MLPIVVFLLDGLADRAHAALGGRSGVEAASTPEKDVGVGGRCTTACACGARNAQAPSAMMPNCGTSFTTVVSTCTQPAVRAPRRLTNTNSHTTA